MGNVGGPAWLAGHSVHTIDHRVANCDFTNSTPQFEIPRRLQLVRRILNVFQVSNTVAVFSD